ncbi:MAG: hypothetical protein Q7R58_02475 [bacterium]|nr:hypothetical protein [bacterium]
MAFIVPAVLPSSRKDLEEALALFARIPAVSRIQIDIVDGTFASPASWPFSAPSVAKAMEGKEATKGKPTELEAMARKGEMLPHLERITYEIDLMCVNAERIAEAWLALGATRLTFHAESTTDLGRLLASARRRYGAGAGFASNLISFGIALNLASDLALIEPYISEIEYVQFMGIAQIGRQGQPFDRRVLEKVRMFRSRHPKIPVQVDGGISLDSAKKLAALSVSNLVVGSALLGARDPAAVFATLEALQSPYEA